MVFPPRLCCVTRLLTVVLNSRLSREGAALVMLCDKIVDLLAERVEARVLLPHLLSLYEGVAAQSTVCLMRYLRGVKATVTVLTRPETKLHHKRCFTSLMQVPWLDRVLCLLCLRW